MSSESVPTVPPTVPPPPLPSTLPWTLADEEALIKRENAITHLQLCIARRDQCEIDLITFRRKYSETVIKSDPILHSRHILLINDRKEAWEAYFQAYDALYPKTIEDILWSMAKAGHTQLVAPLMNLSKVTRNCIHLQPLMMNIKWGVKQWTQLHYCAENGLTTSVKRLLSIRNIDMHSKDYQGKTPLFLAAMNGHAEIVRLLVIQGADIDSRSSNNQTAFMRAAIENKIDSITLLFQNGADLEATGTNLYRAIHYASFRGFLPLVEELVLNCHVDVHAKTSDGSTALRLSTHFGNVEHFLRNHVSQIDVPAVPAVIAPVQHMVPVVPLAHENMNIAVRNEDAMIGVGGGDLINRQARQAVLHLQRDDIDPMSFPDGAPRRQKQARQDNLGKDRDDIDPLI
jgi:hypothetical protein